MRPGKHPTWYAFVRATVRLCVYQLRLGGIKTIGAENVPKSGPVIICGNHASHLDPPGMSCGLPRRLSFMAKEELFRGLFGKILTSLGAFPVRRGEGDSEAIRTSLDLLASGEALLVFPEGTRNDGHQMLPTNPGVAMMAKRSGAPVLPVAILGTDKALPKGAKKMKRHKITLVVGEPIRYADFVGEGNDKGTRERFMAEIANRICQLAATQGVELLPPQNLKSV
jgi:1-acyl-sn-glycerol-3-phosphate acyltransferase